MRKRKVLMPRKTVQATNHFSILPKKGRDEERLLMEEAWKVQNQEAQRV